MASPSVDRPPVAVLLDAYGTLIGLDPPGPHLQALLAADGCFPGEERINAALAAEMAHYRRSLLRGRDRAALTEVRRECTAILAEGLAGEHPPLARLMELLLAAMRFHLYPDVLPALDALSSAGTRLAVVSNWDCSLHDVLAGLGVAERFELVVTSAGVGLSKPDPGVFHAALGALGLAPHEVVHCGDEPVADGEGARAAGVRAVIVRRPPAEATGPDEIASLEELVYRASVA